MLKHVSKETDISGSTDQTPVVLAVCKHTKTLNLFQKMINQWLTEFCW